MRVDRLFQIVYILLDKKRITAKELADKLEVSTRTVYRDIDALAMAGIPVYASKGKYGGISLLDNFVINKSVLSNDEQNKILIGLELLKATDYENVDDAILKLKTLFKKNNDNWIEVDFSYWGSSQYEKNKFEDLKNALTNCKSIQFDYYNFNGEKSTRAVNPLKLIFKQKDWYLLGYCLMREDYRIFKIYRMDNLKIMNKMFDRDKYKPIDVNFMFTNNSQEFTIKVNLSAKVKHRVFNEFNLNDIVQKSDGSYDITFNAVEDEWLYNYIISFGSDIKVIEPSYMNDIIRRKLQETLSHYSEF